MNADKRRSGLNFKEALAQLLIYAAMRILPRGEFGERLAAALLPFLEWNSKRLGVDLRSSASIGGQKR